MPTDSAASSESTRTPHRARSRVGDQAGGDLLLPGRVLDGTYQIRRALGRGSMGLVYLADDLRLQRQVAIKVLAPRYASDEHLARRFRREAAAMASVRATNVVQVYCSGDVGSLPYFVMEYVPGYTVASLVEAANSRGEQIYLDVVLGMLRQVGRGLQAVHDGGIVHRDVKPANMLVGPGFRVALTDFGLVERLSEAQKSRGLGGTPLYLAPEIISGQPVPDTQRFRADIYALGVSAFEMLVGHVPFDGPTVEVILRAHLEAPVPRLTDLREDLPTALDAVITRAMHKDPDARFGTCAEFLQELERARQSHAALATGATPLRLLLATTDREQHIVCTTALTVAFPRSVIHVSTDGEETLRLAGAYRPHVIVIDVDSPGMDGLVLCASLSSDAATRCAILALSRSSDEGSVRILQQLGAAAVLSKPVAPTALVQAVRACVPRHIDANSEVPPARSR